MNEGGGGKSYAIVVNARVQIKLIISRAISEGVEEEEGVVL